MPKSPAVISALLVTATVAGCAGDQPTQWVRARDDAISLRSALYWCGRTKREKYHKSHPGTVEREKKFDVDEKCMATRGWKPKP